MSLTIALVSGGRPLDATLVSVGDGASAAYGCGGRLANADMSQVAWVTGQDADRLADDLASVFHGSGATITVVTEQTGE